MKPVRVSVERWYDRLRRQAAGIRAQRGVARRLPSFVMLGTQRAGTTSLYAYLTQHSHVRPAVVKEVHYYDHSLHRGLRWYAGHFPTERACHRRERRIGGPILTGEASPSYLFHPHAAERLARDLPAAKLIVLLRDPVERARSHYQHEVRLGFEHLSFADALAAEPERLEGELDRVIDDPGYYSFNLQHYSYAARGHYHEQIRRWLSHFPREQFLFIMSEDLFDDPAPLVVRVQEFIGLAPEYLRSYPRRNASSAPPRLDALRNRLAHEFAASNAALAQMIGIDPGWTAPVASPHAI